MHRASATQAMPNETYKVSWVLATAMAVNAAKKKQYQIPSSPNERITDLNRHVRARQVRLVGHQAWQRRQRDERAQQQLGHACVADLDL